MMARKGGFCYTVLWCNLEQRRTTFLGQRPQCIIFSALKGRRQNYKLTFRESRIKKLNFTIIFIACGRCGLILLPSELFWIVISFKIANSSTKFKFIHKISLVYVIANYWNEINQKMARQVLSDK